MYDIPALIHVHIWVYDNGITILGSQFEVQKLSLLSISLSQPRSLLVEAFTMLAQFAKGSGPFQLSSSTSQHWMSSPGAQGQGGLAGVNWQAQSRDGSCYTLCNYADSDQLHNKT